MSNKLKFLLFGTFSIFSAVLIAYLFYQEDLQNLLNPDDDSGTVVEAFKLVRVKDADEPETEYSYVQRGYLVSASEDKLHVRIPEITEEFTISDGMYMFCLPNELGDGQPLVSAWVDPDELFSVYGTQKFEGSQTNLTAGTLLLMYISETLTINRVGVVGCATQ